jgi:hypothetical protein
MTPVGATIASASDAISEARDDLLSVGRKVTQEFSETGERGLLATTALPRLSFPRKTR